MTSADPCVPGARQPADLVLPLPGAQSVHLETDPRCLESAPGGEGLLQLELRVPLDL